jgi:hypothetical protein
VSFNPPRFNSLHSPMLNAEARAVVEADFPAMEAASRPCPEGLSCRMKEGWRWIQHLWQNNSR